MDIAHLCAEPASALATLNKVLEHVVESLEEENLELRTAHSSICQESRQCPTHEKIRDNHAQKRQGDRQIPERTLQCSPHSAQHIAAPRLHMLESTA